MTVDGIPSTRDYAYNKVGDLASINGNTLIYNEAAHVGTGRLTSVDSTPSVTGDETVLAYDDNGNITTLTDNRTVEYTSFNKPSKLEKGNISAEFVYNAERSRMLKVDRVDNALSKTTVYFGAYEKITTESSGEVKHRFHISAGGALIAIHSRIGAATVGTTDYLHKDALGSTDLISNQDLTRINVQGYTPFGARRDMSGFQTASSFLSSGLYTFTYAKTMEKRGFTRHEHVDELDLIHMNGRVYDPGIGRFLSPDPHVQMPKSTQGYNRYAYVQNNPLKYTDPSGYFLKKLMRKVGRAVSKYKGLITSVALGIATGGMGNVFLQGFIAGFGGGLVGSGGDFKAAFVGRVFGGISAAVAGYVNGLGHGNFGTSALHGLSQGVISEMRGGKFREGFLGGFASHYMHGMAQENGWLPDIETAHDASDIAARTAFSAMAGGISSKLGGGKFENGAWSAAFVHLFNAESDIITKKLHSYAGRFGIERVGNLKENKFHSIRGKHDPTVTNRDLDKRGNSLFNPELTKDYGTFVEKVINPALSDYALDLPDIKISPSGNVNWEQSLPYYVGKDEFGLTTNRVRVVLRFDAAATERTGQNYFQITGAFPVW